MKIGSMYGYREMKEDLARLQRLYPFLKIKTIGKSVLGKRLVAIRIGTGKRQVHYNGSFHAREWITTPVLMKFIEDYAKSYTNDSQLRDKDMRQLFQQTSLWIVPMVNPDGVELVQRGVTSCNPYYERLLEWNKGSLDFSQWKANIHGVDLNRQYPAHWEEEKKRNAELGVTGPGPLSYAGTAPLTEPEAIAIAHLTQCHDFCLVMAFHTQGQEIYWNYRGLEPPESEMIANSFAAVSGYQPIELTDSDAGYKDWFIQEYRRPGFTIECGIGTHPLPLSQFSDIYEDVLGIMLEGLVVTNSFT
jgi:g-D-glutamyl-meso-diaminopimelate peptidase